MVSWYPPPGGSSEDFQLFRDQLDQIGNKHKGNKLPSVHVLGDFNFKDIAWPDPLIDIMNDHGLEQLVQSQLERKTRSI